MDIYLRIEHDGSHVADLAVRSAPSHTVRDVADAIAEFLGLDLRPGFPLSSATAGLLNDTSTVVDSGLLSGGTLELGTPLRPRVEHPIDLTLVVASGPDCGRSIPLQPGTYTVGRDALSDLVMTDPQVSRRHLRIHLGADDELSVELVAEGRNDVRTDAHVVRGVERLQPGQVLRLGASSLVVRRVPRRQNTRIDAFGHVPFHRTPYFPAPVQEVEISAITEVPERPEKTKFAYLSAVLPVMMGLSFFLLFGQARYLLFIMFSPIMVIGNYFENRRRSGRKFKESVARFRQVLGEKSGEVRAALADERDRRFRGAPDLADLERRASKRTPDLWIRSRDAYDFLELRVGVGDVPTTVSIRYGERGDLEYRDEIVAAYGDTEMLTDVPVTVNLAELGTIGLIGRATETSALASSLAVQTCCLHSPEDLVVFAAMAPARGMLDWLKWAPHTRSSSSPLPGEHLVGSKSAADALLAELIKEAGRRLETRAGERGADPRFPWLLVLLDRAIEPDPASVSRLLDLCPSAGISVVWLTDTRERVPRQAQAVVDCQSPLTGEMSVVSFTDPDRADRRVDLDRITGGYAAEAARALAPLRDASSANAATAIPRTVPIFTALGVEAVTSDWVARQWKTDRGYSLRGPIGYTDTGPMILDLVEHGPHGLIGGTSGAGKSELVMSMVAGLIAYNPPERVNFLFVDYKGGASSALFKDVPHTVGYVTNLDGLLSMRALTSLRAELNRRMALMQGKAKDLAEMIERHPEEAPPSLVIVVDEFATLVKEIPDFVAGVVDIAQRGRSLGIHLMLATQRPSGSVNDNIKANTNLRISLRMLDASESSAVIGTPDAANIPAPLKGRGFARMGPGDLIAFQSAWAGAPLLADQGPPPVAVAPFGRTPLPAAAIARSSAEAGPGSSSSSSTATADRPEEPQRTQVDALLDAVVETSERHGHHRGRAPWLEVLPLDIPIDDVRRRAAAAAAVSSAERPGAQVSGPLPGTRVTIGMIDDPEGQAQYPVTINFARSGGLAVCGAGGSGKTTALATVALSAAMDDSERGVGGLSIFVLDFASRELGGLNRLPQCGGVATSDNIEAVTRIISKLHAEFERRRQALADAAALSQAAPRETTVLLLIDGFDALQQTMDGSGMAGGLGRHYEMLTKLLTDGRQVAMCPVITVPRWGVMRSNISTALTDRLTLRQGDPAGYGEAGVRGKEAADLELEPGQGFLNGPNLAQLARLDTPGLTGDETDGQREQAERERLVVVAESLTGQVDSRLTSAPLPMEVELLPSPDPARPVVGLADMSCDPYSIDLTFDDVLVLGDPRSGRSTALAAIGAQVAGAGGEVWVLAPAHSALRSLSDAAEMCLDDGEAQIEFVAGLAERFEGTGSDRMVRPVLLLDDYDQLPENDRELNPVLEPLLKQCRVAASGGKGRGYSGSPVIQHVRSARTLIYMQPPDARDAQDTLGARIDWHPGLPMVDGRCIVMANRVATIVQLSNPFPTDGP